MAPGPLLQRAGIDYQFYKTAGTAWIIGFEYQHINFGTVEHLSGAFVYRNIRVDADVAKAKLSVKFGGPSWFW